MIVVASHRRPAGSLRLPAFILALLGSTAGVAQAPAAKVGPREGRLTDRVNPNGRYAHSDAAEFGARVGEQFLHCEVVMAKPFAEGMFTCVELYIDCDDNPKSGIDGDELRVRAAVGSRFRSSAFALDERGRTPLVDRRASYTILDRNEDRSWRWLHQNALLPQPTIDGNKMRFDVPLDLIRKRNMDYTSLFRIRVQVETSCTDQSIEMTRICNDDGIAIEVDGDDSEWTGELRTDPVGELHPAAQRLDLKRFRLEHSPGAIYASVSFAEPGFGQENDNDDIHDESAMTFYFDPLFPRYQRAAKVVVRAGRMSRNGKTADGLVWRSVTSGDTLEIELRRRSGQTRFKVFAWADYRCVDAFDDRLRLDWSAKQ